MKKNILLVSAFLLSVILTSCSKDFLETESKTDLNTASFYQTEVQMDYAIVGCYDGYQRTVSNGSWPTLFQAVETMSDDCLGGGGPDDRSDRLMDRFDMSYKSDAVDLFDGIWGDYYKAIYRCNLVLGSIETATWTSDANKLKTEAQARALRGLEYFDLVRMFENVPLVTVPTSEVVAQATPDEVYAQIVEDLKWAADNMPADAFLSDGDFGRITKYAAEAMLARVYLFYDGVYNNNAGGTMPGELTKAQALQYCEDVIASGNFDLEANFKDLFPASATTAASTKEEGWLNTYVENSKENIWTVKFNFDQDWNNDNINGNRFLVNLGMRNVTGYAPYGNGWGACPITPYAASIFNGDDMRGDATIINCRTIGAYDEQAGTDCMDYTGYVNKKYCPLIYTSGDPIYVVAAMAEGFTGANMQTTPDQNWVLMRYSDVLLMAAELGSGNAVQYFNKVRERAYGSTAYNISAAPSKELVWNERRLEFMGEGVRYFDLMRQGLDAFVAAQMGQATSNGLSTGTAITVVNNTVEQEIKDTYVDNNIRSKRGFFQIPQTQINLSNGVYKQNAGW